jgi:glutathione S-transferase
MPTPTEHAQTMLDAYQAAELAILAGKEVRIGGVGLDRWLKLEDLDRVQAGRKEWEKKLAQATGAAAGVPTFGGARMSLADVSNPGGW